MRVLGNGLYAGDQHEDSLSVEVAELAMMRRLGASEAHILATQNNLASSYQSLGRLEEANRMLRDVYSGRLKLLGEEHPHTLSAANNYAYDVDAVEAMLVRSRLFQRCPTLRTFQEGDVSNLAADAGPINGTYCRRYRDAAVATRASFNENPWELMRNNNR